MKNRTINEIDEKAELLGEELADGRWHWGHTTKKSPKWTMVGDGDQIGACMHEKSKY